MVCVLLMAACTSKPMNIELARRAVDFSPTTSVKQCKVTFKVLDTRPNKTLGQMGGQPVSAEDSPEKWLADSATTFFSDTIVFTPTPSESVPTEKSIQDSDWQLVLKKAYVHNFATSIAGNTVVSLENKKLKYRKIFRGKNTKINWVGAKGEALVVLNTALTQSFEKMKPYISKACQSKATTKL